MSGLTELGDVLHEEHFRIVVWMSELKNRVTGEASKLPLAPTSRRENERSRLIEALDHVFLHHAFEEDVLFPQMCDRGESEAAGYFANDHAAIDPVAKELQAMTMELLTHGADGERWRKFRHVVNELFSEMMNHLVMEEMVVLQRLHTLIDPETDRYLARQHWSRQLAIAGFNRVSRDIK
ncbi:MAG TPA: hemerythrin domain-containing protein [Xanthobacteraceae bacterium]|nr:hemerythrin domain-containing protein [Xanthobacteraceae bacterium]